MNSLFFKNLNPLLTFSLLMAGFLSLTSFYLRLNYWDLILKTGLYQGDIWYFYNYYGGDIQNNFFYPIEYPVGYVIIQKITYFLALMLFNSFEYQDFLIANMLFITPLSILTVYLTYKLSAVVKSNTFLTMLILLASPTFFIATSTNYDIFPISLILLSLWLVYKKRFWLSFLFLAIGAAIKLYPGFLIPIYIFYGLSQRYSLKQISGYLTIFFGVLTLINLPFYFFNPGYWQFPFTWQAQNPQRYDLNTLSSLFEYFNIGFLRNYFFLIIIAISWAWSWIFWKKQKLNFINLLRLSFFCCFSAVFANHVNTPQYLIWFLPFIAIFNFPKIFFWWPFDLLNSSVLYTYFKLHYEWIWPVRYIFSSLIVYFLSFYISFWIYLKKYVQKNC